MNWSEFKAFVTGCSVVLLNVCLDAGMGGDAGGYFVFSKRCWLRGKGAVKDGVRDAASERKLQIL